MDLKTLKAQHPQIADELVQEGVTAERKRASSHVKMARSTGATEIALKAIESGASLHDDEVHAEYMSFALNKRDRDVRQSESDAAGASAAGAKPLKETESTNLLDRVADAMGL